MIKLKKGREEIIYLLTKAIEKYKAETGHEIIQNTNRKNYEGLAQVLSEISNQLPHTEATLGHDHYAPDKNQADSKYPFRKYDITGGQIKDAISGIVSNPRPFLVDACYIYLFTVGRKGFALNPLDANLTISPDEEAAKYPTPTIDTDGALQNSPNIIETRKEQHQKNKPFLFAIFILLATIVLMGWQLYSNHQKWQTTKRDLNILQYQPTKIEIDSLEGIWLNYIGSPQARLSNANRYHLVVPNIVEIKFKDGYFILNRYGANFNHVGYAQFEAKNLVSFYSRVKNALDSMESPRHTMLTLTTSKQYLTAISTSWNFDVGEKNKMIGIREVFIKLGKGGSIEEVMNEVENSSCQCKIIRWHKENKQIKTFYLKNELLDTIPFKEIRPLINEKSILFKDPEDSVMLLHQ
ncbi:hypothetical protein [Parasediminibacterium sp. JCM 36343]|uniref:hypothetical protein n=1 Tax=Parasediminibacterium sp. JCM 36343 TaxID=3374279 RepID=UPI00397AE7E0